MHGEKLDVGLQRRPDSAHFQVVRPPRPTGVQTEDISWIWRMEGTGVGLRDNDWLKEGTYLTSLGPLINPATVLRVQFLNAKTTLDRWREEVELTVAELLHTTDYFKWVADFWAY